MEQADVRRDIMYCSCMGDISWESCKHAKVSRIELRMELVFLERDVQEFEPNVGRLQPFQYSMHLQALKNPL